MVKDLSIRLQGIVLLQFGAYRTNARVSVGDSHMHIYSKCIRTYNQNTVQSHSII